MGQSCTTSFDLPLSSLAPYSFIFEWKHRQIMQNQVHLCFWRWLDQEVHLNLPYLEQSTGQMPSLKSLIDFAMVILFAWICFPIFTCLVCLLFLLPLWLTSPWSLCAQFSCSVMSDCNPMDCSMTGFPVNHSAYSNSCPSCRWCHPTISSSVIGFSSHLQSFPAWGSFPKSKFFTSGGQNIGVSP